MVVELGVFSVTSAIMLVATGVFALWYLTSSQKPRSYLLLPAITGIAGVLYAVMALSSAGTIGQNVIVEARYLDWVLTTPMIVAYIGLTAGANKRLIGKAMAADAVMIAAGYVATTVTGTARWAGFAVSMLAFIYLLYLLVTKVTAVANDRTPAVQSTFRTIRDLTIVLWCVYPILWLMGPSGFGVVRIADYHFVIASLDLTAKVGFDAIVAARAARVSTMLEDQTFSGALN